MVLYGTVEVGGTKTDVAVGTSPADLTPAHRITTTGPVETLSSVIDFLGHHDVSAVGVACFGPLNLDPSSHSFGTMLTTPKPGWSDAPVWDILRSGLGVPVAIDTDVNGAALGEGIWGATQKMSDHVYVTIGTGVGAGIVRGGELISGERHPEAGHVVVTRRDHDTHPGSCPYHGACLEGMASGPALEARFGRPETWAGRDGVSELAAHYLAQGLRDLVYIAAPERIVIGGGVAKLPGFHDRCRLELDRVLAGYPVLPDLDLLVAQPGLGDLSGLAGGLVLAARAAI